jgi:hypothetical protein
MSESGSALPESLNEVEGLIAKLRAELRDDPDLSPEQRAAIIALIAYYVGITRLLINEINSLMHGE